MPTEIAKILNDFNIPLYRVLKKIGINPLISQTNWRRKINGETSISEEEFKKLCAEMAKITGKKEFRHVVKNTQRIFLK